MGGGFDLATKQRQLATLQENAQATDLWSDPEQAGQLLKKIEAIQTEINDYQAVLQRLDDLTELVIAGQTDAMAADLVQNELEQLSQILDQLENSRFLINRMMICRLFYLFMLVPVGLMLKIGRRCWSDYICVTLIDRVGLVGL